MWDKCTMEAEKKNPKGILSKNYVAKRRRRNELNFRYRLRAEAVNFAVKRFHTHSDSPLKILDMGAAEGSTLLQISKLLPNIRGVGVEYNEELVKRTKNLASDIVLLRGDVNDLNTIARNQEFDVVSALAVLEHLKKPMLAVKEASRILKQGGLFIATSPMPFWDHLSIRSGLLAEDHHLCDISPTYFRCLIKGTPSLKLMLYGKFMWAPIGILPYFRIMFPPSLAFKIDTFIASLKVLNFLFVNQLVVAKKL